mmetsp:Transcript_6647/g.19501  ORF Transcript_6647/g.19501 Transcript_6647/m.19501 type:complete len:245 (+) Transcript_6647:551-1285(+)
MKGVGPTPVDHTSRPCSISDPSERTTVVSLTSLTWAFTISTPDLERIRAAYSLRSGLNIPKMSRASIRVMRTEQLTWGTSLDKSSFTKFESSPANSTPVGPPPTITKFRSLLLSDSLMVGIWLLAMFFTSLSLMALASFTSLRGRAYSSTPGMPKVLPWAPVAIASLSYSTSNSLPSAWQITTCLSGSTSLALAVKKLFGCMPRAGCRVLMLTATDLKSRVPTVVDARSGVNTMWFLGETTVRS